MCTENRFLELVYGRRSRYFTRPRANEIMKSQDNLIVGKDKIKRFGQFIERDDVAQPLIGIMWEPWIRPIKDYVNRIDISQPADPNEISVEEMCFMADRIIAFSRKIPQDMVFAGQACFGHQWLEAIIGCRIMVSGNTIWAKSPERANLEILSEYKLSEDNIWFKTLLACHKGLVKNAEGRYPVALPILHGPLDLLSAYVGAENLAYGFSDQPEMVLAAMDRMTLLWCEVAKKLLEELPMYHEGYVSRMHVWTPQPCVTAQNDATFLTSKAQYLRFVKPFEDRINEVVPFVVYHCHNTSIHIFECLAESSIGVVQITIDFNGPSWEKQKQSISRLQQSKPVVLSFWSIGELKKALSELEPRGLALTLIIGDTGESIGGNSYNRIELKEFSKWYRDLSWA